MKGLNCLVGRRDVSAKCHQPCLRLCTTKNSSQRKENRNATPNASRSDADLQCMFPRKTKRGVQHNSLKKTFLKSILKLFPQNVCSLSRQPLLSSLCSVPSFLLSPHMCPSPLLIHSHAVPSPLSLSNLFLTTLTTGSFYFTS